MTNTWWRKIDELIPEQTELLAYPVEQSILIKGPPGSGKTNLLLLRANHLFLSGKKNIYILVFGNLLKAFIRTGGSQYAFPQDQIITHSNLFMQILRENGLGFDSRSCDFQTSRNLMTEKMQSLIDQGRIGKLYDALFLDESQDYTPEEIRIFRSITKTLVATADSRQRIYDVDDCMVDLIDSVDREHILRFHFRNGLKICALADGIMSGQPDYCPMVESSNYDESSYPSSVLHNPGYSLEKQIDAIIDQVRNQRIAYPADKIGVLCPKNDDLDVIFNGLSRAGFASECTKASASDFNPECPIWISTLSAAKGLEFRALHIAGLDSLSKMAAVQKRLIYTGVTRAKTALTLYSHIKIPPFLDSAICALSAPPSAVAIPDIFGGS